MTKQPLLLELETIERLFKTMVVKSEVGDFKLERVNVCFQLLGIYHNGVVLCA